MGILILYQTLFLILSIGKKCLPLQNQERLRYRLNKQKKCKNRMIIAMKICLHF